MDVNLSGIPLISSPVELAIARQHAHDCPQGDPDFERIKRDPPASASRSTEDVLLRACFAFGLIFLFPAFTVHFAFDPTLNTFTGSLFLQFVNAACEVLAFSVILRSRSAIALVKQCRTVLVLIGTSFLLAPSPTTP